MYSESVSNVYHLLQHTELVIKVRDSEEQKTVLTVNWIHLQLELTRKLQCLFRLHNEGIVHSAVRVIWKNRPFIY